MSERKRPEVPSLEMGTLKAIQSRIVELTPFGEADFRIVDPATKKIQILHTTMRPDIRKRLFVGLEVRDEKIKTVASQDPEDPNREQSKFIELLVTHDNENPRVRSFAMGYYNADEDTQITFAGDSLTEEQGQDLLVILNRADADCQIDAFGQTGDELQSNRVNADILRSAVDQILELAREEKKVSEYVENGPIEQARYKKGDTKIIINRQKESGFCTIDIQGEGENSYVSLLDEENNDDSTQMVRPRRQYIVPAENFGDQRIHYGLVFDKVEDGQPTIDPQENVFQESFENIANQEEYDSLITLLSTLNKSHLLPPR